MQEIEFSDTGIKVSEMCLGTMMFGDRCNEQESVRILNDALSQGINFIDTAAAYCGGLTEEILGRYTRERRDDVFICTKVTKTTDSDWIKKSLHESLVRLQTDYVDIFKIHWPRENTDTVNMMETLNTLVVEGKTRFIGCCNFPAWYLAHCNAVAERHGWAKLISNQVPYSVIERGIELEVLPQATPENIAITVYRPLAQGLLAGKYKPGQPVPTDSRGHSDGRIADWFETFGTSILKFTELADQHNMHPAQLAVAWVRHSPAVTAPIVGVSSGTQLQSSIDAFDVELSEDDYTELTDLFDAAPREYSWGNYASLRRSLKLVSDGLPLPHQY